MNGIGRVEERRSLSVWKCPRCGRTMPYGSSRYVAERGGCMCRPCLDRLRKEARNGMG